MTNQNNYVKGIFLVKFKSKDGKEYFKLAIKNSTGEYDKYVCFESKTKPKYGECQFSILKDEPKEVQNNQEAEDDLPF